MQWLVNAWYKSAWWLIFLSPLSWIFRLISGLRRLVYRMRGQTSLPVPVVVVGNLTVGGTGKTPAIIALIKALEAKGWSPGVISRGYGSQSKDFPLDVSQNPEPHLTGDEPYEIFTLTGKPVVISPKRLEAAQYLLQHHQVDIILSDDGLQHYALPRDIEVVVIDGVRRFGNAKLLPAGPLREPTQRLNSVDFVLVNGGETKQNEHEMTITPKSLERFDGHQVPVSHFSGHTVHGVAGIGHPERFFTLLEKHGLKVIRHPFADHHRFCASDLDFGDERPIIMTRKDASKCQSFADSKHWFVNIETTLAPAFVDKLLKRLEQLPNE